jgi:hypothetical protein
MVRAAGAGLDRTRLIGALGVSLITVKTWCADGDADIFRARPKWRVDTLRSF